MLAENFFQIGELAGGAADLKRSARWAANRDAR
jgi:hypothetical protein